MTSIEFVEDGGAYVGIAQGGRAWRITRSFTGWRMEFRDNGDTVATYAGVHASLQAAQAEANRPIGGRSLVRGRDT